MADGITGALVGTPEGKVISSDGTLANKGLLPSIANVLRVRPSVGAVGLQCWGVDYTTFYSDEKNVVGRSS